MDSLLASAPREGTLEALLSPLSETERVIAYHELLNGLNGRYSHVTLSGSMKKWERRYTIGPPAMHPTPPLRHNSRCDEDLDIGHASKSLLHSKRELELTAGHVNSFVNQGFTILRNLIHSDRVREAACMLNNQLGIPGAVVAGGAQGMGLGKLQGSCSQHRVIRELLSGPAQVVLEGLLGCRPVINGAQIALRFPHEEKDTDRAIVQEGSLWHTDGLRQGKVHPFSVLCGVALSDVTEPFHGNLLLWPKTHRLIGLSSDHDEGNLETPIFHDNEPGNLPHLGPPQQLELRAGDVVLVHPDLAHTGGPNFGPQIRSMVYFRVKSSRAGVTWEEISLKHMQNMWSDFAPNVQAAATEASIANT
eukprot:GSChrysophyteH1.ASY1.ANO1.127.1 assembled CDS